MGIYSKLVNLINKVRVIIDVTLDAPQYLQGDTVRGKFCLNGISKTYIDKVYLELFEEWLQGVDEQKGHHKHKTLLHRTEIASRIKLQKNEKLYLSFQYKLPLNIRISHYHHKFFFFIRASIPRTHDATVKVEFEILPSIAIQAVQEAMAWNLGFTLAALQTTPRFQIFKFRPSPGVPEEFNRIEQIDMIFTHKEDSLWIQMSIKVDIFLWLNADNYFTLNLLNKNIFLSDGSIDHYYITDQIVRLLRSALLPVRKSIS